MSPFFNLKDALDADMKVFSHLIYEYEKGVRNLVLYTLPEHLLALAEDKLKHREINYFTLPVNGGNVVNIFFGENECIDLMQLILSNKNLDDLSPEEDFMLGILLGYDQCKQCKRFLQRKNLKQKREALVL